MEISIIKEKFTDLFFPKKCVVCGRWEDYVCARCLPEVIFKKAQECPRCNKITEGGRYCLLCRKKHPLNGSISAAYYKDPIVKALVRDFKYGGISSEASLFANWLTVALGREKLRAEIITFVPISKKRLRKRGYNQSEILATELSRTLGLSSTRLLRKTKETPSQVGLSQKERIKNLADSFEFSGPSVAGKKILIVDDVMTTGATLNECARILKEAGAKEVWGATIAKE